MPNMEIAVMPTTPVAIIACAIVCCDRKTYGIKKRPRLSPCTSLGKKKDTCVRHTAAAAFKKNKITNVKIEPEQTVTVKGKKIPCKPDFMVDNRIIDVKFQCDEEKLKAKIPGRGRTPVRDRAVGAAKKTKKERIAYRRMKGPDGKKVKSVRVMGPKEAKKKMGKCVCN